MSVEKRLIIEEIKRFSELYKPNEGIGEQGLDELADEILSFSKDYISKDKIRELIEKYEQDYKRQDKEELFNLTKITAGKLSALNKLLEEN